jgi:tape measure domain-containing protein
MASRGVTTDLVIRATEIKTKPLDDLLVTLGRLTTALNDLDAEGGPASKSFQELTNEARKFEAVSNELAGRRALFEVFKQAKTGADLAGKALADAKRRLEEFNSTAPAPKARTDAQREEFKALEAAVKAANTSFRQADKVLATTEGKLQRIGVTAANVADELARLVEADDRAAAGFTRATQNAQGYQEAVRNQAAALKAKAVAEREAAAATQAAADAARKAEQAEHDRLALLEQVGRAQQRTRGQEQLQEELQILAEHEAALKRDRDAQQRRAAAIAATTKALAAQKAAEREAAVNLRATGIEAQDAATATGKLAQAARELAGTSTASTKGLAQAIGEIVDPSRRATLSMSEVQRELAGVIARQREAEKAFHMTEPALKQLAADHGFLARALRDTETQAGLIEGYQRAQKQFTDTGAALDRARQALEKYAAEARTAGTSDAALEAGLRKQRAELEALLAAYQRQAPALSAMGTKARDAGVDLRDLATAEQAVTQQAQALRSAMDAASSGTTKLGQATEQARAAQGKWGEEQRTALSLTQRIRGQILSLTAAYVGLFGVLNEARASLDALTSLQGVNNRLAVAFGEDAPKELERIRKEADRLGIGLQSAAEGYSRFAIAARAGGATADETFFIFSKFSEVSRVFKLGEEEQKRVFKALEQMMSKGKISAEELTQQLGDALPGALDKMAKAMKMSPAELFKAMEKGQVSSRNLLLLANEYGQSVRDQVVPASQSWQAELQRLQTALFNFRQQVGAGGFADEMGKLSRTLSDALSSEEGARAAQALSDIFSSVALALRVLVPVVVGFGDAIGGAIETVKSLANGALEMGRAFQEWYGVDPAAPVLALNEALREMGRVLAQGALLAGVMALIRFASAAGAAYKVVKAFSAALVGAEGLAGAMVVVRGGVVALTAAWATMNTVSKAFILVGVYEVFNAIGDAAYKSSVLVRLLGAQIVGLGVIAAGLATGGIAGAKAAYAEVVDYGKALVEEDKKRLKVNKQIQQVQVDGAKRTAQELARRGGSQAAAAKAATDAESARLAGRAKLAEEARLTGFKPVLLSGDDAAKKAAAEAKKAADAYAALLKQVENGVDALELRSAKAGAQELNDAIAALDKQYETLYENIAKLNAKDEAAMRKRADAAKAALKVEIEQDFARKAAAAKVTTLLEERDALLEVAKAQAEVDPAKALSAQQEQIAIIARYKDQLLEAARAALALAESQGKVVEAAKLRALITKTTAFDPAAESRKAQIEDAQRELTLQQSIRDAKIAAAVEVANQNDPTGQVAAAETVRIMGEFQQGLTDTATKIKDLAVAAGNLPLAAQMDGLLAKLSVADTKLLDLRKSVTDTFVSGFGGALTTSFEGLAKWIGGVGDFGDAWVGARDAFRSFASEFLMSIAKMIIQQQALNVAQALMGGGQGAGFVGPQEPGVGSLAVQWLKGLVTMHNGGTVGGANGWSQSAPAAAFAGAPRFHGGGLPGLAADEVPAILQRGEEVLSKNNPRNILNGGGAQQGQPAAPQPFTIVNTFKPEEVVAAGLTDRAFVNYVAANKNSIKRVLG